MRLEVQNDLAGLVEPRGGQFHEVEQRESVLVQAGVQRDVMTTPTPGA